MDGSQLNQLNQLSQSASEAASQCATANYIHAIAFFSALLFFSLQLSCRIEHQTVRELGKLCAILMRRLSTLLKSLFCSDLGAPVRV